MGQRGTPYRGECLKIHHHLGGKIDGCQEFKGLVDSHCIVCGCHVNFHKEVVQHVTEVVYTECQKIHHSNSHHGKDGCKEFSPGVGFSDICEACECHKSFHRNEVTKEAVSWVVKEEGF